ANAMALGFAEESGLKLEHALIRNHYVGRTFINPIQASRNAKVKIKFNPVREVLAGKKVVVVDDSLVRGTTSRELVQMIRQAGAREVHFRVASAPITGPCYYGIDTPTKSELIASSHSLAEIRDILGGKGAGLAEMANLGLPVPPGFTISAKLCITYLDEGTFPPALRAEVDRHLKHLEKVTGKGFGDARNPLLVSVRSGAA